MKTFRTSPAEIVESLWGHFELLKELVKRDVGGRYRGSVLGLFWSFVQPMVMLFVYTFVFSVVFSARWKGVETGSKADFAMVLFAGLIVFTLFAECINRAAGLMLANANYVKRVVFPLEILVWVSLGSALFHAMVSFAVWLAFYVVLYGIPHATVLLLPFVLLPLVLMIAGVSWFFAALGVYLRDLVQLATVLTTVLMFLSPIFYPASAIPESLQPVLLLNPLAPALEHVRGVLMWGQCPDLRGWAIYVLVCSIIAWLGFAFFQKMRRGFADVL